MISSFWQTADVFRLALFATCVLCASFLQFLGGFGFALLAMPAVALLFGIKTAAPLVAMLAFTVQLANAVRLRKATDSTELKRLSIATALGVPFGIALLGQVRSSTIQVVLGAVLLSYAAYAIASPPKHAEPPRSAAYAAGWLAGCLAGAFNLAGPPLIVYADRKIWDRHQRRATLQTLFAATTALTLIGHGVTGHFSAAIVALFALGAPLMVLGNVIASRMDTQVSNQQLRLTISVVVALSGISLVASAF